MKRIVVEGMRGKSEVVTLLDYYLAKRKYKVLSKVTGLEPIISNDGVKKFIRRQNGFLIDHENKRCLKLSNGKDFVIFENQGISPYTMRLFHNILKPEIILIPNIRLEHQETLGETIEEISKSFAVHFDVPKLIIAAEQKESVLPHLSPEHLVFLVRFLELDNAYITLVDLLLNPHDKFHRFFVHHH